MIYSFNFTWTLNNEIFLMIFKALRRDIYTSLFPQFFNCFPCLFVSTIIIPICFVSLQLIPFQILGSCIYGYKKSIFERYIVYDSV